MNTRAWGKRHLNLLVSALFEFVEERLFDFYAFVPSTMLRVTQGEAYWQFINQSISNNTMTPKVLFDYESSTPLEFKFPGIGCIAIVDQLIDFFEWNTFKRLVCPPWFAKRFFNDRSRHIQIGQKVPVGPVFSVVRLFSGNGKKFFYQRNVKIKQKSPVE